MFKNLKKLEQIISDSLSLCEYITNSSTELLHSGYPKTKEDYIDLRFNSQIPHPAEAIELAYNLSTLSLPEEYDDIKSKLNTLITRMIMACQTSYDIIEFFSQYGVIPDDGVVYQLKSHLAFYMQQMLYEYKYIETRYNETLWPSYAKITHFIPELKFTQDIGQWVMDNGAPHVLYKDIVPELFSSIYDFINEYDDFSYLLNNYIPVLNKNGIQWKDSDMANADPTELDGECILALFLGINAAERFSDGTIGRFFKNGCILKWLNRLEDLDYE